MMLLGSVGATLAVAMGAPVGAMAQTAAAPATATPPDQSKPAADQEIVVTGSRIKRTTYNSPSPITVITAEQAELTGEVDTSHILQLSSVANNAAQINNSYSGYVVTGGPGVNTLSLRGIGAQRTLILIDGQRMGPAGVGGTVGPIDLNTIPASIIDRIEIENDGASSIYGSDAVAGVVNIITKKNLDGGDFNAFVNPSQGGGGNSYQFNGDWGKTFDKGYFTAGFDIYQQDPLQLKQRPYLECARDVVTNPTNGKSADIIDPATGSPKCFNLFLTPGVEDLATGGLYAANPKAVAGGGAMGTDLNGFQAVGLNFSPAAGAPTAAETAATLASEALIPYNPSIYGETDAISPVSRYTFTLQGGLDLTPHDQLYGSMLLNQRDSRQVSVGQFFGVLNPDNPFNTPGFGFPLPVIPEYFNSSQKVNYARFVGGVRGDLPSFATVTNLTYDIYAQLSDDEGAYTQSYQKTDRVNATMGAGAGTNGCDVNALQIGGSGETMAQAEPGVACVPVNYIAAVQNGGFTPAEQAFLFGNATGHTGYKQYYIEGSTNGDLFQLPAGPLGVSLGFQVRREDLDDKPPADFINANVYNFSTSGITKGSEEAQEVFGELAIPVIKAVPLIKNFDISLSGRVSNYNSYGTNETYKIGFDWAVTDWLTLRGTDGTAFRAPALYEQFLANQTSFLNQISIDPCIQYGSSGASLNVQKNCAAQGIPANFAGGGSGAEIFAGGGSGLKPETSINQTAGIVFTPKWFGLNLKIAATYFAYDIKNQIQQFGAANILYQCYNSPSFPNSPFCSLFSRDNDPTSSNYQGINTVNDDYVNVAEQYEQGMDLDIDYRTRLPKNFKLAVESHMSWSFYNNTILLNGQTNNYLGQVGQPGFEGNVNFRLDHGPWTVNYYIEMVGHSSDNPFISDINTNYYQSGETVLLNHVVPFYTTSDVSVRRKFDKFSVELGVKNLFDTPPPVYSAEGFQNRIGTVPLTSQYDLIGRSFFVTFKSHF